MTDTDARFAAIEYDCFTCNKPMARCSCPRTCQEEGCDAEATEFGGGDMIGNDFQRCLPCETAHIEAWRQIYSVFTAMGTYCVARFNRARAVVERANQEGEELARDIAAAVAAGEPVPGAPWMEPVATFKRLRNGNWGLQANSERVRSGDLIKVEKRNGQSEIKTIGRILWRGDGRAICTIAADVEPEVEAAPEAAPVETAPVEAAPAPSAAQLMEAAVAVSRIPSLLVAWVFAARLSGVFHVLGRWTSYASVAPIPTEAETIEAALAVVRTEGQRLAQVQPRQSYYRAPLRVVAPSQSAAPAPLLGSGDFIAGAAAAGHGLLVGWNGLGELTRADLAQVLAEAELPNDWMPSIPSPVKHAGEAVRGLQNYGYVVRRVRAGGAVRRRSGTSWKVGSVGNLGQNEGDSFGKLSVTFTLVSDVLSHDGDDGLAAQVLAEYTRTTSNEIYKAAQITKWLGDVLRDRCGAVKTGCGYYVPRAGIDTAKRITQALRARWGAGFFPGGGLPVATSAELRQGMAEGLAGEVAEIARDLENYKRTRKGAVGERAATTYISRLSTVADRVKAYANAIGAELVAGVKAEADALIAELSEFSSDTAQRGALIWEELARDAK